MLQGGRASNVGAPEATWPACCMRGALLDPIVFQPATSLTSSPSSMSKCPRIEVSVDSALVLVVKYPQNTIGRNLMRKIIHLQLLAFASLLLLLCPARRAAAAEYVVGDVAYGWDSGINYAAWAREHAFAVGDVLVFQYVSTQHNVYEVTEDIYGSCDTAGGNAAGVRAKYTSGDDRVVLAEPRDYWFICDFPGHCLGGMKVAVNVSAGAAGGGSPPPDSSTASMPGGRRGWVAWGLVALGILALLDWPGPSLLLGNGH